MIIPVYATKKQKNNCKSQNCIIQYEKIVTVTFMNFEKERISMDILRRASAGTMESSDAYIEIEPGQNGLSIQLESVVLRQFGDSIDRTVREVLAEQGVANANVRVIDRGALECVLRARVETAVLRGKGEV